MRVASSKEYGFESEEYVYVPTGRIGIVVQRFHGSLHFVQISRSAGLIYAPHQPLRDKCFLLA